MQTTRYETVLAHVRVCYSIPLNGPTGLAELAAKTIPLWI